MRLFKWNELISDFIYRQNFRPAYSKLSVLSSYFPNVPVVGLTATATLATQKDICWTLGLIDPIIISVNPDRPNIYFESRRIKESGDARLELILSPLVSQLKLQRLDFPLTLIYGNLKIISDCYEYFSNNMENEQYHPVGASPVAKNRLFSQFHAQYPDHEREKIVKSLVEGVSKIRILFVTVAFGIGIDLKNIRRVIHIGVPYTMEEYFQEAGRCGRDGQQSEAIVFYNSTDISAGKKHLTHTMRNFVQESNCKRQFILNYFGYKVPKRSLPDHTCCDGYKCTCDDCLLPNVSMLFDDFEMSGDVLSASEPLPDEAHIHRALNDQEESEIRNKLEQFRLTLHGCGRSCVGGIELATGFSIGLIDEALKQATSLESVDDVLAKLPVFSYEHAKNIYDIVSQVMSN